MTTYMLKTHDNPLERVRQFLKDIWNYADLDGMFLPIYRGKKAVEQTLIYDVEDLRVADPFVPLMQTNAGKAVGQLARKHPHEHMAAILRPCEIRALYEQVKHTGVDLENWLIIGVDCPACFPLQDFEWRVEKAGSVEELTHEVLRNVRQGSIALDRFRPACGMCRKPGSPHEEICLGLLGLPVKDTLLIEINDEVILHKLDLDHVCDGLATPELIEQHERMLKTIEERREHIREHQMKDLAPNLPNTMDEFIEFLHNCQPCISCMESCPVHADKLVPAVQSRSLTHDMVLDWLSSCAECGMCEQYCPKEIPLVAIADRIRRDMRIEDAVVS